MSNMFTLYSKVNCTYCAGIEKVFNAKGIEYTKYVLNIDFSRYEFIEKFGRTTFPQVLDPSGNTIGGASETVKYLKSEGLV